MLYCRLAEGGLAGGIGDGAKVRYPEGSTVGTEVLRSRRVKVGFAVGLIESVAVGTNVGSSEQAVVRVLLALLPFALSIHRAPRCGLRM
jgi:hypothetical protein